MHGATSFTHCVNIYQLPVAEFEFASTVLVVSAWMSVPDQPGTAATVVSKGKLKR